MTTTMISEYGELDATALAGLVRRGEVSSLELLEEAIRRLEQVNGELNAVIYKMYDHARAAAAKNNRSGPFAGVPFLMKDFVAEMGRNESDAWQHDVGVAFAQRQVAELLEAQVPGIHFYVLNRSPATAAVLRAVS